MTMLSPWTLITKLEDQALHKRVLDISDIPGLANSQHLVHKWHMDIFYVAGTKKAVNGLLNLFATPFTGHTNTHTHPRF